MKPRHPGGHVVLEELRQVLVVEAVEDLSDDTQRSKYDLQSVLVVGVLTGQFYGLDEELGQRFGKVVQHKLDLLPQLLGLELH